MTINAANKYEKLSLAYYFLPLLAIWLILSFISHHLCCIPNETAALKAAAEAEANALPMSMPEATHADTAKNETKEQTSAAPAVRLKPVAAGAAPFAVSFLNAKGDTPVFAGSDSFNFPVDDFIHTVPLSGALQNNLVLLRQHLGKHPKKRLNVVGKYLASEKNRTMFPNLGLARANDMKAHLVSMGFNPKQINMQARLSDEAEPDQNGILYSMADFEVDLLSDDLLIQEKNELALIKERIITEPLVLMFQVGEAEIGMSDKQREQMLNIVNYVSKAKGAKVKVTGHTDSLGTEEDNLALGKDRAEFAKKFLMDNGMEAEVIAVYSRGETMPIATNATEEGRAQNRRTVVTVE